MVAPPFDLATGLPFAGNDAPVGVDIGLVREGSWHQVPVSIVSVIGGAGNRSAAAAKVAGMLGQG